MAKGLETFVDWFAGIGGFRLAGERNGLKCVGACDNDKYARQTYKARFGHEPEFSDAREVDPSEVPDHDLFCAGFPCPAFSLAGKRAGFKDERGALFFEIARIIEARHPNYFLLENVKGLLSAPVVDYDGQTVPDTAGWVFLRILETLGNLGYSVQWQVLHGRRWVPQDRQRVYIVGNSRTVPFPEVLPLFDSSDKVDEDKRRATGPIGKLHKHQGGRVYGPGSCGPTLDTGKGPLLDIDGRLRIATMVERERMQGFEPGWTEGVSDQQRIRQTGNAIVVQAATEVIRRLVECHGNQGRRLDSQGVG
jgi:DNA (cytosine-5)-methyltransferase 1